MTYKTHVSVGLTFSAAIFLLLYKIELQPILIVLLIISTVIGSSAPDLDTPTGELWDKIPAGSVLSRIIKPVFIGGHRHLSHSIIGLLILSTIYFLILKLMFLLPILSHFNIGLILLAFIIGYFSHLFADMFTEMGVPLLFPLEYHFGIPPDPLGRLRIKTGRWFENLIIYPIINIVLLAIIILYIRNQGILGRIIN
ncbi:MAG: Membrane protein containing transrane [Candidatus Berkelbacteria bacterium]|nr:Membrane protein containing transrane [Candidatus Berkelbacteria bacterium]